MQRWGKVLFSPEVNKGTAANKSNKKLTIRLIIFSL